MYSNKIGIYQGDCEVLLGKYPNFSDYIKNFSRAQFGRGLDLGCGPGACNGRFFKFCRLDACDAEQAVVDSVPNDLNVYEEPLYRDRFLHVLGRDTLPYAKGELDFVILSCVIQHLNSFDELKHGLNEINRVLKTNGQLFFMFKSGTNDTLLTHHNSYYGEDRTFRVFHPQNIQDYVEKNNFRIIYQDNLLDDNFIPYSCFVLENLL